MDDDNNYIIPPQEDFIYHIDLSIETGDIKHINTAIAKYKAVLSKTYIDWGNRIIIQIIEEKIEDMDI